MAKRKVKEPVKEQPKPAPRPRWTAQEIFEGKLLAANLVLDGLFLSMLAK